MVAFDIAHTVAYLHAADILVKNLSDVDVVLIKEKERWKPILTNVERARFVGQPGSDPHTLLTSSSFWKTPLVASTMSGMRHLNITTLPDIASIRTYGGMAP
jgi:hypothetical protein